MQLPDGNPNVEIANPVAIHECSIITGPKMFDILIRQYGEPLQAAIRELACNAADSHIKAGKPDVPFHISLTGFVEQQHIPTQPIVSLRDFGVGMSHEKVITDYTTVGHSDKTNDANVTGCLGIGSKSPLGYTDHFILKCYSGKDCRVYCVAKNPTGVIVVLEQGTFESDEPRGLEVSFAIQHNHVKRLKGIVENVVASFGHPHSPYRVFPKTKGFDLARPSSWEDRITPITDIVYRANSSFEVSYVMMGNVRYPLNVGKLLSEHTDASDTSYLAARKLFGKELAVCLCVPLGDHNGRPYLTFPPSRDAIELTPQGVEFLLSHLKTAADQIVTELQATIDSKVSLLEAARWVNTHKQFPKNVVRDICRYKGREIPCNPAELLALIPRSIRKQYWESDYDPERTRRRRYDRGPLGSSENDPFRYLATSYVVLVDQPSSYRARVEHDSTHDEPLLFVRPTDVNPPEGLDAITYAEAEFQKLGLKTVRISELDPYKPDRKPRGPARAKDASFLRPGHMVDYPTLFWSSTGCPAHSQPVVIRVKGFEAFNEAQKRVSLQTVKVAAELVSHKRSVSPETMWLAGLRYTDWKAKQLPENCISLESFLKGEMKFWNTWAEHFVFAEALQDIFQENTNYRDLLHAASFLKLKDPVQQYLKRAAYWFDWESAAASYSGYAAAVFDVSNRMGLHPSGQFDIDEKRCSELKTAAKLVFHRVAQRFPFLTDTSSYWTSRVRSFQRVAPMVELLDKSLPVGDMRMRDFPKLKPFATRPTAPDPLSLAPYLPAKPAAVELLEREVAEAKAQGFKTA